MSRNDAVTIVRRLQQAGHTAVLAGGCVRDRLLDIEPKDHDIATSATPDEVESLFDKTFAVGRSFGVIVVPLGGRNYDVATFRSDGRYLDGRHPENVEFTDARNDALRRDFTINALFEDPIAGETLDYVEGRDDLAAGLIRAVGDPAKRFAEDRLRMLRAVRFAARFGFAIESDTMAAIRDHAAEIGAVSAERIGAEIACILTDGGARTGFELLDETGLLRHVLPEVDGLHGCEQSPDHHPEGDVFVHTMLCIGQLPAGCSLGMALGVLLHDIAKPPTAVVRNGKHTFYGHTSMGADMAQAICARLRYSNETTAHAAMLVDQHLRHCAAPEMRRSTLKRFLRQEHIDDLLELARIDAMASSGDLSNYEYCLRAREEFANEPMRPKPLVDGSDLIKLGWKPGPAFKPMLTTLEDAQLEGSITTREEALALLLERFGKPEG